MNFPEYQKLMDAPPCYVCLAPSLGLKVETTRAAIPVCKHCLTKRIPRGER